MKLTWFFFFAFFYQLLKVPYRSFIASTATSSRVLHVPQLMVHSAIHVHNFNAQDVSTESNNLGSHCQRPNIKMGIYFSQKIGLKKKEQIIIASIFISSVLCLILWTKRLLSWLETEKFYQDKLFPASLYFWVH